MSVDRGGGSRGRVGFSLSLAVHAGGVVGNGIEGELEADFFEPRVRKLFRYCEDGSEDRLAPGIHFSAFGTSHPDPHLAQAGVRIGPTRRRVFPSSVRGRGGSPAHKLLRRVVRAGPRSGWCKSRSRPPRFPVHGRRWLWSDRPSATAKRCRYPAGSRAESR